MDKEKPQRKKSGPKPKDKDAHRQNHKEGYAKWESLPPEQREVDVFTKDYGGKHVYKETITESEIPYGEAQLGVFYQAKFTGAFLKKIPSPGWLWGGAESYFKKVDADPWVKNEAVKSGDMAGMLVQVPTSRPYTIGGLLIHIGVSMDLWKRYRDMPEYKDTIEMIEAIVYDRKYTGAAVGAYNPMLISKDLGLVEKTETKHELMPTVTGMQIT